MLSVGLLGNNQCDSLEDTSPKHDSVGLEKNRQFVLTGNKFVLPAFHSKQLLEITIVQDLQLMSIMHICAFFANSSVDMIDICLLMDI